MCEDLIEVAAMFDIVTERTLRLERKKQAIGMEVAALEKLATRQELEEEDLIEFN
jgi:hypothetical protein